jgi:protein phosphatase PTC7
MMRPCVVLQRAAAVVVVVVVAVTLVPITEVVHGFAPLLLFTRPNPSCYSSSSSYRSHDGLERQSPSQQQLYLQQKALTSTLVRLLASNRREVATATTDLPTVLASEGDWNAYLDVQTTGLIYYFNGQTGESRWDPPTPTFPAVQLTSRQRRLALQQQARYQETQGLNNGEKQQEQQNQERSAGREERRRQRRQQKLQTMETSSEQPDWFDGLFGGPSSSNSGTAGSATRSTNNEEAPDWFGGLFESSPTSIPTTDATVTTTTAPPPSKPSGFLSAWMSNWNSLTATTAATTAMDASAATTTTTGGKGNGASMVDETIASSSASTTTTTTGASTTTVPEYLTTKSRLDMVSTVLPAPTKVLWGGEDAVLAQGRTFGVFDGVTSAQKSLGVRLYSKYLAAHFLDGATTTTNSDTSFTMPELVDRLTRVRERANTKATGATTAMVASISEQGFLRCLNVGDSTLLVIRPQLSLQNQLSIRVVAKSREIIHYWECPYQLSADSSDEPRQGTKLNVELLGGDICIMGSDGIFDNLNDRQVISLLTSTPGFADLVSSSSVDATTVQRVLQRAAQSICDTARRVSQNATAVTPYAVDAQKQKDPQYASGLGGKVDDISCILVRYQAAATNAG